MPEHAISTLPSKITAFANPDANGPAAERAFGKEVQPHTRGYVYYGLGDR